MRTAKAIAWIGVFAMSAALYHGFTQGDFFVDGGMILDNPWGIVSLVDLYVGFTLFSMWIFFREKSIIVSALWILSVMVLGFFSASLYVAINLSKSKGNWTGFFMGWRSS